MRSLFLSYDSLLSPLGQSQILPYLRGLQAKGHEVSILSFEPGSDSARARAQLRRELASEKIAWRALRYHKRPTIPATALDIATGVWAARAMIRRNGIHILHARSYVPMLIGMLAAGRHRIVFDMRGFWADERFDTNQWNRNRPDHRLLYRLAKRLERWGLRRADHVVVLTQAACRMLGDIPGVVAAALPPVSVIPTCVDLARFQPAADKAAARRELGLPAAPILVFQGEVTRYMLCEMAEFIKRAKARRSDLLFLVLAPAGHDAIRETCRAAGLVGGADFRLQALPHGKVAQWVAAADGALCFRRESFSTHGSCPTKIAECLACGIPVVVNEGIGDVAATLTENRAGPVLPEFTDAAYDHVLNELETLWSDPDLTRRCRNTAESCFALSDAVARYDEIYKSLDADIR
jgi:glycosyltransferase involved in cell wall biosynthesis